MAEELNESNPRPSQNQPKPGKAENLDSRLPYKPPTLRKHGKVNQATETIFFLRFQFDGFPDFTDIS